MPRTCSHIKTNGVKCGTFALRHHTKCYFHYQWERRELRRVRLGGPVGLNKNTGIELPILDSPAAILLSIMEIQHALLDARIDHKSASTLLYSIQLAIQVQPNESSLGSHTRGILECPELEHDLEMERARGLRPAAETCNRCPKQDDCTSPSTCRKLPKPAHSPTSPSSRPEARSAVVEGPASTGAPAPSEPGRSLNGNETPAFCHAEERSDEASLSTAPAQCHPERSAKRGAEGSFVSSPEAAAVSVSAIPWTSSALPPTPCHPKQKALRLRA